MPVSSAETDAFRWAIRTLDSIGDPRAKGKAKELIEHQMMRWKGEHPQGDYNPDPYQQIIENAAASLGVDLSDKSSPLVQGLQIAARDNSPERVLRTCEYLVTSRGATGPTARQIELLFGTQMAGSKILHCALHNYHHEAKDFDSALAEFRSKYCNSCPHPVSRPTDWKFTDAFRREFQAKHEEFIKKFNTTGTGFRFTSSD